MPPKSKKAAAGTTPAEGEETECTERDVLLGRGKRISEWPGNIYFRQVVNKYRDTYHASSRKDKVKIADKVLQDISAIGGRVLQQNGDKFEVVQKERAIEKACQALREKEKSRPPETSPFGSNKVITPPQPPQSSRAAPAPAASSTSNERRSPKSPATRAKKQSNGRRGKKKSDLDDTVSVDKKKKTETNDTTEEEDGSISDDEEVESGKDETSTEEDEEEEEEDIDMQRTTGVEKLRVLPDEQMIARLEAFKERHGHCAIPPFDCLLDPSSASRDSEFVSLADWCSAQRQIYQEIRSNFRKPSEKETERIKKLSDMGFCWDYESWHWDRSFDLLQEEMKYAEGSKTGLSDEALEWIRDQHRRAKRGMLRNSSNEAVKKLKSAGIAIH